MTNIIYYFTHCYQSNTSKRACQNWHTVTMNLPYSYVRSYAGEIRTCTYIRLTCLPDRCRGGRWWRPPWGSTLWARSGRRRTRAPRRASCSSACPTCSACRQTYRPAVTERRQNKHVTDVTWEEKVVCWMELFKVVYIHEHKHYCIMLNKH